MKCWVLAVHFAPTRRAACELLAHQRFTGAVPEINEEDSL